MPDSILTMPTPNNFTSSQFGFMSQDGVFSNDFTGIPFTVEFGGAFWQASFTIRPMKSTELLCRQWQSFFAALGGRSGRFYAYDPDRRKSQGTPTGTPLVNGANQRGNELVIDGCTPNVTGWLKAGDYIEVNDEFKMVTADVDTDGSGNATIPIFPVLRTSPPDNEAIITTNAKCIMMLDAPNIQWQGDEAKVVRIQFSCREAFNFDTFLMTEDDDNLITEDGDYLIL